MSIKSPQGLWQVVYTLSKREKAVHERLKKLNICSYLPLHFVIRQWSDRKKKLSVPLFPNYVFVKPEKNENHKVLNTPGVVRFLSDNRDPATISEEEIIKIKLLANPEFGVTKESEYAVGDRVRVACGPLIGLEGMLIERKGAKRFAIQLSSIDSMLSIDIQSYSLEAVA